MPKTNYPSFIKPVGDFTGHAFWSVLKSRYFGRINNKNVEQKGQLKLASSRISGKEEEEATAKFYVHIFLFFSTKSIWRMNRIRNCNLWSFFSSRERCQHYQKNALSISKQWPFLHALLIFFLDCVWVFQKHFASHLMRFLYRLALGKCSIHVSGVLPEGDMSVFVIDTYIERALLYW